MLGGGFAAVIALLVVAWLWARAPDYRLLFSNLSERDGGDIITALSAMQVPYRVSNGGAAILVPEQFVYETRLKLATQGLPRGGSVGYELMDSQKFGISQFMEQVNYQRALAGELSRTIQSMSPVQTARIHIAVPRPSVFVRDQQKPSASVLVNLHPGRSLDPAQVGAITHLVASSVPELSARNVTVVDQNGKLLSADGDKPSMGLDASQLEFIHAVEQRYVRRIEDILEPIVGSGNVRAQVTAMLDFSQTEQTSESYKPNPTPQDSAVRSQQTVETVSNQPNPPAGVPGALSNQPPGAASAPLNVPVSTPGTQPALTPINTHKENTVNFEIDKTIRHVKGEIGAIKRLSAAVVVNYRLGQEKGKQVAKALSEQEMSQITNLVREAMGFSRDRGDSVNVVNAAFSDPFAGQETSQWKQLLADYSTPQGAWQAAKYLAWILVIAYAWFALLRPALRDLTRAGMPPEEITEPALGEDGEVLYGPDGQPLPAAEGAEGEAGEEAPAEPEIEPFAADLEAVKLFARQEPKLSATILKEWIDKEE